MKFITPLALIALMAVSCSKEESVDNASGSKNKIKSYTYTITETDGSVYTETINVSYDDKDRVKRLESSRPGNKVEFTYSTGYYVMDEYFENTELHATFYLNNQSAVDSMVQYNEMHDTSVTKYVYNPLKQIIQQREYDFSTYMGLKLSAMINYTYDAKGLVIKEENSGLVTTTFKYDKVVTNTVDVGLPYFPVRVQLPTQTTIDVGGTIETTDYTYTFDNNNRLINEMSVTSNGLVTTTSYTYY